MSEYENQLSVAIREIDSAFGSTRKWTEVDEMVWYQQWSTDAQLTDELNRILQKDEFEVVRHYDMAQDVLYISHKRGTVTPKERYFIENFIALCYANSVKINILG